MNALDQLVALFSAAAALVEKELLRSLARDAKTTARQKNRRLAEIRAILSESRMKTIGTADDPGLAWDVIRAGYERGLREAARTTREPGGVDTALGGIHLEAVRALYASLSDDLEQAMLYVEKASSRTLRKVALNEVLAGQLAGRSQARNAEAIAENLRSRGIEGFTDKRGRRWSLAAYAAMAAQTATVEAQSTALLNRAAENGFDLVRWSTRPSVGGREACEACRRLDGKVFSITGTTEGYEVLTEAPPKHPRCGCLMTIETGIGEAA